MTKIKVTKKKLSIDMTKSRLLRKIKDRCNKNQRKKIKQRYDKKQGCLEKN